MEGRRNVRDFHVHLWSAAPLPPPLPCGLAHQHPTQSIHAQAQIKHTPYHGKPATPHAFKYGYDLPYATPQSQYGKPGRRTRLRAPPLHGHQHCCASCRHGCFSCPGCCRRLQSHVRLCPGGAAAAEGDAIRASL